MKHLHRMRPTWLLLMSPAWLDGWHRICTHAVCSVCGAEAVLAGWQTPAQTQGRVAPEGE